MLGSNMSRLTRRHVLKTGGAVTFAGYAVGVDKVLAQVIKTDTQGIVAGDVQVKIGEYAMPVYEAHPATGSGAPILLVISEIWGVHEWIKDVTRRFAKEGYYAVAPELFQREGGVAQQGQLDRHVLVEVLGVQLHEPLELGRGQLFELAEDLEVIRIVIVAHRTPPGGRRRTAQALRRFAKKDRQRFQASVAAASL